VKIIDGSAKYHRTAGQPEHHLPFSLGPRDHRSARAITKIEPATMITAQRDDDGCD
jgi:hypothetical protein